MRRRNDFRVFIDGYELGVSGKGGCSPFISLQTARTGDPHSLFSRECTAVQGAASATAVHRVIMKEKLRRSDAPYVITRLREFVMRCARSRRSGLRNEINSN